MNAMQKVAWLEMLVSFVALVLVGVLIPWLGVKASVGFSVLSLIAVSVILLRQRDHQVVFDERDLEIQRRATAIGAGTAWVAFVAVVAVAGVWASHSGEHAVSTIFLNWLVWFQFAVFYAVKGLAAILLYRRQEHAA